MPDSLQWPYYQKLKKSSYTASDTAAFPQSLWSTPKKKNLGRHPGSQEFIANPARGDYESFYTLKGKQIMCQARSKKIISQLLFSIFSCS